MPRSSFLGCTAIPNGLMTRGMVSTDGGHSKGDLVEGEQDDFPNQGLPEFTFMGGRGPAILQKKAL